MLASRGRRVKADGVLPPELYAGHPHPARGLANTPQPYVDLLYLVSEWVDKRWGVTLQRQLRRAMYSGTRGLYDLVPSMFSLAEVGEPSEGAFDLGDAAFVGALPIPDGDDEVVRALLARTGRP